ncbi:MAG: hypothetical protein A2132_05300 [Nitrospirae bacterium RBG_16_43_11]|nr:MAG: hypothetical protein A2132_05300 [Nitrospirae bacterium RBG_16_43_11]
MSHPAKIISLWKLFLLFFIFSLGTACDKNSHREAGVINKLEVTVGRLICGGHLPLAVVEKKYQDDLTTFRLKTVQNHDWKDVMKDLKTGRLAGTFILSPLAMEMIRDGFPVKIVLKADRNGNSFVLSKKIKSIDALKDRKTIIAVPHIYSQHNVLLHMTLKQHNISLDKVTIIGMPPRDMINSLRSGEIDGFMVGEPEGNKSVELGVGWMASISPKIWKDHMDHVFIATDQFINGQPEQLQELINALVRSGRYIEANPHEAAVMGEDFTGSNASVFEKVLTTPDWIDYTDMVPTIDELSAMSQKLVDMGLWKESPDDLASFIDTRFVEKAVLAVK